MFNSQDFRAIRKALGMNTTQFATRLGVAQNTVARWELGDRYPRRGTLQVINALAKEAKQKDKGLTLSVPVA